MLSAERPYPLHGGGAFRTASLLHYFAQFADVDLILLAEDPIPSPVPSGILRAQRVIPLKQHRKTPAARYRRNARRALLGVPPLIDRLSGLSEEILRAMENNNYSICVVEHFWCAPYIDVIRKNCEYAVLNLHNVESVLHQTCARLENPLVALGHIRFAVASRRLERKLLPRYDQVLAASLADRERVMSISPGAKTLVYPNALPWFKRLKIPKQPIIVFSANFEYHPNIDAASILLRQIWPVIRKLHPEFRLRLIGRGDRFVRHLARGVEGVDFSGALPETMPEVAAATVSVAPLRAGSGTRIKLLEAWAAGCASVATSLAAEGLQARPGENILLADEPGQFAAAVCRCIQDEKLRTTLEKNGRQLFEEHYCWPRAWESLNFDRMLATPSKPRGYTGTF